MVTLLCMALVLGTTSEDYLRRAESTIFPDLAAQLQADAVFRPDDLASYKAYVQAVNVGNARIAVESLRRLTSLSYLGPPLRGFLLAKQAKWELGTQQKAAALKTLDTLKQLLGQDSEACMYVDLAKGNAMINFPDPNGEFLSPLDPISKQYEIIFAKYKSTNRWIVEAHFVYAATVAQHGRMDPKREIELSRMALAELKKTLELIDRLALEPESPGEVPLKTFVDTLKKGIAPLQTQTEVFLQRAQANNNTEESRRNPAQVSDPVPPPPAIPSTPTAPSAIAPAASGNKAASGDASLPEEARIDLDRILDNRMANFSKKQAEDILSRYNYEALIPYLAQVLGDEKRNMVTRQKAALTLGMTCDPRALAVIFEQLHKFLAPDKKELSKEECGVLGACIHNLAECGIEEGIDEVFKMLTKEYWSGRNISVPGSKMDAEQTVEHFRERAFVSLPSAGTDRAVEAFETGKGIPDDLKSRYQGDMKSSLEIATRLRGERQQRQKGGQTGIIGAPVNRP